jgi:hypothetical protein
MIKEQGLTTFVRLICLVHSVFRFLVFGQSDQKRKKSAVLFVYFLYIKSAFCLKMTADFFIFWSLKKRKAKNGMNLTKPERIYNPITAMGFSAMFTFQLNNTKR